MDDLGTPVDVKMLLEESKVGLKYIVSSSRAFQWLKIGFKGKEKVHTFLCKMDKD